MTIDGEIFDRIRRIEQRIADLEGGPRRQLEIGVLSVSHGEVLVIRSASVVTPEERELIAEQIAGITGRRVPVFFIGPDDDISKLKASP